MTHDSNFAERERPAALDLCSPALRDERPPFATASCARSRPADAARRCLAVAVLQFLPSLPHHENCSGYSEAETLVVCVCTSVCRGVAPNPLLPQQGSARHDRDVCGQWPVRQYQSTYQFILSFQEIDDLIRLDWRGVA